MKYNAGSNKKYRIEDVRMSLVGQQKDYGLRVEIAEYPTETYPNASFKEYTGKVNFLDPSGEVTKAECEDPLITSWTVPEQTASLAETYSNSATKVFRYAFHETAPSRFCRQYIKITCATIIHDTLGTSHPFVCADYELDDNLDVVFDIVRDDYFSKIIPPGKYYFTYHV